MAKQRTDKSASKRFKVTGSGKVLHRSHYLRHIKHSKSKRQVRDLKKLKPLEGVFEKKVKQMLGIA